jgi:hypothetical protein
MLAWFWLKTEKHDFTPMSSGFSVYRFGLAKDPAGKLTQRVQSCGKFANVETAFATARAAALQEWEEALAMPDGDVRVKDIRINDTEWGYDLKRDHLTVARFWVHDGQPKELG